MSVGEVPNSVFSTMKVYCIPIDTFYAFSILRIKYRDANRIGSFWYNYIFAGTILPFINNTSVSYWKFSKNRSLFFPNSRYSIGFVKNRSPKPTISTLAKFSIFNYSLLASEIVKFHQFWPTNLWDYLSSTVIWLIPLNSSFYILPGWTLTWMSRSGFIIYQVS